MKVIGILNITPDSCSDGGLYLERDKAVAHAKQMVADGAFMVDIGGESTRPGAKIISPEEELKRVLPVVQILASQNIPMSIDTRNASTAKACLEAGVTWLNDVSALTHDPKMPDIARQFDKIILMHMRGIPETMQQNTSYLDIISEIKTYLADKIKASGILKNKLLVDPGLGFGKSTEQCLEILKRLREFQELAPVYIGPSRKNFIGELTGILEYSADRDYGTIGAVLKAAQNGADFVRVHNVKAAIDALAVFTE
ncbi:MAG: dihydropteroate synthase [Myxococcaceae bacterium]